jgi:hypothetical protein
MRLDSPCLGLTYFHNNPHSRACYWMAGSPQNLNHRRKEGQTVLHKQGFWGVLSQGQDFLEALGVLSFPPVS